MTALAAESKWTLTDITLFSCVPDDILADVNLQSFWHRLPAEQLVIDSERKQPHGVFVLAHGEVDVFRPDNSGEPISLGQMSAPDCFGEFAAIFGDPGSVSVRTRSPCRLAEIPAEIFVSLVSNYPSVSLALLRRAISLVRTLDDQLVRRCAVDTLFTQVYRNALLRSL